MLQQGDHEGDCRLVDDYAGVVRPNPWITAGSIFKQSAGHYTGN